MPKSGHKIFISFKFKDSNVYQLKSDIEEIWFPTTVRDYVNKIEKYFEMETDNIYKGERDNEDLSTGLPHYTFFTTFSRHPSCLSQSICFPEIDRFFAFVNSEKSVCFNMFMTS
ncbi:MAG: hypothetical protein PUD17_09780, partial [Treponema sp.]|uniref:hypothetical protein n=1 Tax=Treponema sp. TaxID=166 RepID=UPI00298E25D5